MIALELPDSYGYVLLFCGVLPSVTNVVLGFPVTKARKEFDVQYPNLYATPGFHKKADEFNRVQRGHQHLIGKNKLIQKWILRLVQKQCLRLAFMNSLSSGISSQRAFLTSGRQP
mmetsp:Transcript_12377/g.17999  ORF Transcript_12377/g.17999 Transcript_12377/m.17999 type:complete len:115 (+) Transcript_12377:86-430(+)